MEQLGHEMQRPDFGARKASSPSEEFRTPSENDLLVTRLVARIAELEERLYKKELEAPAIGQRTPNGSSDGSEPQGAAGRQQQQQEQVMKTPVAPVMPGAPRLRDSLLATLRESWAKLELHAGVGSSATGVASATAAVPMRSLDVVTTPTRASTFSTAGAASASAASHARPEGMAAENGNGNASTAGLHSKESSRTDEQDANFNFSTHLIVDYSKPNRGSPTTPGRALRKLDVGGNSGEGTDDDGDSLSSVGSSGMGYDTTAQELELERRRNSMTGPAGPNPASGFPTGPRYGSVPSTQQVSSGTGSGAAAEGGDGICRRPPLPPIRPQRGSDSGSSVAAPAPTFQQPLQTSGGMPSRAVAWSGQVLSKLGIAWGRDRSTAAAEARGEGTGSNLARIASTGSLQAPFSVFRPAGMGSGPLQAVAAFSDRALEEQLAAGGGLGSDPSDATGGGRYYRYVFDPADVQAEMEVTARVRRAAAEALMEANNKLAEAQAAAAALQQQVEQAKQLEQELEVLRAEHSTAQAAKSAMEDEMATARRQLEAMKETEASLQAELESVRSQADIWRSSKGGESEKLKQENTLLRSQLTNRLSELQSCRSRLSDGEAERQRLLRDAEELRNKIQWLTKINLQLETAASQLNDARRAASEWQERFMRERNVRRRLHDQLQLLRSNIRVMCRVRPVTVGQRDIVSYPLEGLLAVSPPDKKYQEFEFDRVFPPSASQAAVFEAAVVSLVRAVADGHSACVFAYGQTGSGKTYTMQGPPEDPGIYLRTLRELFRIAMGDSGTGTGSANAITRSSTSGVAGEGGGADEGEPTAAGSSNVAAAEGDGEAVVVPSSTAAGPASASSSGVVTSVGRYSFWISMSEIHNEELYDLLAPGIGEEGSAIRGLKVSMLGPGELPPGTERVPGLTWRPVVSMEGVDALLQEGSRNRAAVTIALDISSRRSHSLFTVRVEEVEARRGGGDSSGEPRAVSLLHLVDLAGAERVEKNDITGQQAKDAQSINRSLSALGDVIAAIQRCSSNIPFRNSKLTTVLQDALCGDSKILLLCNIAPEATSAAETVSSLIFASRAAQFELGVARRSGSSERTDRSPRSPTLFNRALTDVSSGGGGGVSRATAAAAAAATATITQPTSPLRIHPRLPIVNGTAAKVRAAAAAAAAMGSASASGSGSGAGSLMRTSQSFVGMNGVVMGCNGGGGTVSAGGASSSGGSSGGSCRD